MGYEQPTVRQDEGGHVINRLRTEKLAGDDSGDDGGDNEGADAFHGDGAEDDFSHEERAGERRIIGAGNARGGTARDEEAQSCGRKFSQAPE